MVAGHNLSQDPPGEGIGAASIALREVMTTRYRSLLRALGIILLLLVGLAVAMAALLGGVILILPGTVVVTFDVTIVARNADGTPAPGQLVELWGYDKYSREAVTGPDGRAEFPGEVVHIVATLAFPRRRPDVFPVHMRFPKFAPLFYRYDVAGDGAPEADVFNTWYEYRFGRDWVGRFNADGLMAGVTKDEYGRPAKRAKPATEDGAVQLFRSRSTVGKPAAAGDPWKIELALTPAGGWQHPGP